MFRLDSASVTMMVCVGEAVAVVRVATKSSLVLQGLHGFEFKPLRLQTLNSQSLTGFFMAWPKGKQGSPSGLALLALRNGLRLIFNAQGQSHVQLLPT